MQIARDTYKVALCFCGFAFHVATRCMRRWQVDNGLAQALTLAHTHPCTHTPLHIRASLQLKLRSSLGKKSNAVVWIIQCGKQIVLNTFHQISHCECYCHTHTPEAIKLCMLNKKATTTANRMNDFVRQCERFDTLTGFGFDVSRFLSLQQHILIDRLSYNIYIYTIYRSDIQQLLYAAGSIKNLLPSFISKALRRRDLFALQQVDKASLTAFLMTIQNIYTLY